MIYKLTSLNNESPFSYRTTFSQQLREAHKKLINPELSRMDLVNFNRQFNRLINNLSAYKKQSRQWSFWSLFSFCSQGCLPDEDLLVISMINETLTNLESILDLVSLNQSIIPLI